MPLGRLDVMAVRALLAKERTQRRVSASTIAKAYRLLAPILGAAVEAGYIARNPCTVKGAGVERAPEMRHINVAELTLLANVIEDRYRALVLVAGRRVALGRACRPAPLPRQPAALDRGRGRAGRGGRRHLRAGAGPRPRPGGASSRSRRSP